MAVKWAVANGSWTDGATWNDGSVPTTEDEVYLNGYKITTTNLTFHGRVSNGSNQDYGITEGGALDCYNYNTAANITIDELDCYIKGIISIRKNYYYGGNQNRFIGNINNYSVGGVFTGRFSGHLIIIGNAHLHTNIAKIIDDGSTEVANPLEITGNITAISGAELQRNNTTTTIIGSCEATIRATNLNFNGIAQMKMGNSLIATILNINGSITYKSTDNTFGVKYTTLNILNPDTFTWKDVSEPRSNPFIILTDADMNNRQQYPLENEVKEGTEYVWGEKVGTYQQPPESVVLKGYRYDNDEKEGTLENENIVGCVTPEDVRKDVPLVGMGVVGTLVVPSVDDVREGVIFDNGSVGTLIVQGGGDRLRIADFGYYTNAQSDTYIVDLTEQDKPKFAVAEERVLIEMFPDLDLDNIPEKYFDDLFVKYLKYRLIVEYYRTAGINSTFTPSEPTTEIVNYQNVRNEVWLNSANIYLKAWGKKYPESIVKPQRILL